MADQAKPDHWAQLASELGAVPPPSVQQQTDRVTVEEQEPEQEVPPGVQPPDPKPGVVPRAPAPQRTAQHWSQLADELGVVREPDSSAARPTADLSRPVEQSQTAAEIAETPVEPADTSAEPTPVDVAKASAAGLAETPLALRENELAGGPPEAGQRAAELAEAYVQPPDRPSEVGFGVGTPAEAGMEPAEKRPSKKRRKRRRPPRVLSDAESTEATGTDSQEEAAELIDQQALAMPQPSDSVLRDSSVAGQPEAPARSKRRRRRRGTIRKKGADKREGDASVMEMEQEPIVAQQRSRGPKDSASQSSGAKPRDADSKEADRKKQQRAADDAASKATHRGIPSWEEAIGMVISANLEARAKNPNGKPSSRSRGARARGGGKKPDEKAS